MLPEREWVVIDDPARPHVHASTIDVRDDRVTAAWFAGRREGDVDTRVVVSHRDPARGWDAGRVVEVDDGPCWNPVLGHDDEGPVLWFKRGPSPARWQTWTARPHGGRWTLAAPLGTDGDGGTGPARTRAVRLAGRLVTPGSDERSVPWRAHVDVAEHGRWTRHPIPVDPRDDVDLIQPALTPWAGGLVALLRSSAGRTYRAESGDGTSWSPAVPVDLPNNNSGLDVGTLPDGRLVVAHNTSAVNWGVRCPLVVSTSADGGWTWRRSATLDDGRTPVTADVTAGGFRGDEQFDRGLSGRHEYSYPALAVADDRVHVTYTWQRRGIVHAVLPVDEL